MLKQNLGFGGRVIPTRLDRENIDIIKHCQNRFVNQEKNTYVNIVIESVICI